MLNILQIVGAVGTIITGAISLVRPMAVTGFTGLQPDGARGLSEIRGVLGGLFTACGIGALVLPDPAARMLGIAYLGTAAGRLISIGSDSSRDRSNLISLAWEIFFGIVLAL